MTSRLTLVLLIALGTATCASAPPNLTPQGTIAYHETQVIKGLDLVRDTAVTAAAQVPPLIPFETRQQIVRWHKAAIKAVHASPTGWAATIVAPLDDIVKALTPAQQVRLAPYVTLVKTVIAEVQ